MYVDETREGKKEGKKERGGVSKTV